ncbi:HAD family hydrolase [Neolewinella aurantiaca]|uniref:HAD family hydrolase n=1 Tax=Neolewinella aurantiaca TaxID=2602767 RepID=A0A5C7FW57_9BACT|nr:HAD family hydrolase [Neolewinella aurantiaca]TXF90614.1 HAD family hydrolase [Neolewinella aurantiaca]
MPPNPSKPQCIIFDCDGVLVDSEAITFGVLGELCAEQGLHMSDDEREDHFLGKSLNDVMAFIAARTGRELPDDFETRFRAMTFEKFKTDIRPVAGIEDLLNRINVPFCVASSGPPHKIRLNLELTGLADYFGENIFSCYDLGKWKPDPAVFLHAATTMGFAPANCVVIEDSPAGVKGAVAGGFRVFGLAHQKNASVLEDAGAEVIFGLNELHGVITS